MSPKPTIIFVPGSWHGPETWNKLASLLEPQQYGCVSIELPTTCPNPAAGFSDDVKAVRQAIESETTQGRDVVVVAHSYGGVVGPSAVKGLTRPKQVEPSSPTATSPSGHVVGIIMMATGFMPTGVGFLEAMGGSPPPIWRLDEGRGLAVLTVDAGELFYHDLPKEEQGQWVSALREQRLAAFTSGADMYSGWMDVPV